MPVRVVVAAYRKVKGVRIYCFEKVPEYKTVVSFVRIAYLLHQSVIKIFDALFLDMVLKGNESDGLVKPISRVFPNVKAGKTMLYIHGIQQIVECGGQGFTSMIAGRSIGIKGDGFHFYIKIYYTYWLI